MKIKDNSRDKKYFTIIPNIVLNHSTAIDQALYVQMKRIAGDNGTCKAGYRYFTKQLGVGFKSYQKSLEYLIKHKWITFVGTKQIERERGKKEINVYKVNDIWLMNNNHYCGAKRNRSQSHCGAESNLTAVSKVSHCGAEIEHKKNTKEEPIKKNIGLIKNQPRNNLKFSKDDYNEIIKTYEELTGIKHSNNEYLPLQQTIKTMFLNGRKKQEILDCMNFINNRPEECWTQWNLQTIAKQLPRYLSGKF